MLLLQPLIQAIEQCDTPPKQSLLKSYQDNFDPPQLLERGYINKLRTYPHFFLCTFSLIHRMLVVVPDFTFCALTVAATFVFSIPLFATAFTFAILLLFWTRCVPFASSLKWVSHWSAQPSPFPSCLSYPAILLLISTAQRDGEIWRDKCLYQFNKALSRNAPSHPAMRL